MKRFSLLAVFLLLVTSTWADDQTRNVQSELKKQGFFYGDVNGQMTAETSSAIRRFQIRNGLEVTGTLTKQTLDSLVIGGGRVAAAAPRAATPPPRPPVNLRRDESHVESDRNFLRREEGRANARNETASPQPPPPGPRDPSVLRPPSPLEIPTDDFPVLFADTPYARAPEEVQQQTLRRAQAILARLGFYRDIVDGFPGPATEEALVTYQRYTRLAVTGRLDLPTLSRLRLLPQNFRQTPLSPFTREGTVRPPPRTYRGIWVN